MKVKINETLKGIDGVKDLLNSETRQSLTLRDVIISSLLPPVENDKQEEKWSKYEIFKKVRDAKTEVDLKAEEVVLIKKCIGKFQPPLILGQAFELIGEK